MNYDDQLKKNVYFYLCHYSYPQLQLTGTYRLVTYGYWMLDIHTNTQFYVLTVLEIVSKYYSYRLEKSISDEVQLIFF